MRFYEVDSSVDAIMSAAMVAQTRASSMGKQGKLSMNGFLQMLANAGIMMDYDGFKTVFDTNPQLKNVIAQFNKDEITFVGDSDDEGAGYEEPQGDMPDDERVAKMAQRATKMRTEEFVESALLSKDTREKVATAIDNRPTKGIFPALEKYGKKFADFVMKKMDEGELPPHLAKMFGKDGTQVDTRTDVMKQMRDIVDNKSAMEVTFGDGKQMVDMYTASVLVQIYDKVNPENKEKIVQRVGTIEKFTKLMPTLFNMIGEGKSPHKKGTEKYRKHMAAMHAGMNEEDIVQEKVGRLRYEPSPYEIELKKKAVQAHTDGMSEQEFVDAHYAEVSKRSGKSVEELSKLWQAYEPRNRRFKERHYGSHENRIRAFYQDAKGMADFEKDVEDNPLPASNPEKETSKLSLTGGSLKLGAIDPSTLRPARSAQGRPTVDVKVNRRRNTEEAWQAFKERSLTKAEKSKMKHYEKKLPKSDFIDRYGKEQGEAIYYATATKMAKKNA